MYGNYEHQGLKLAEWREVLNNTFSLGELYRLAKDGKDFTRFLGGGVNRIELQRGMGK